MKLLKNKWFWVIAFGLIFVLSLDLWAWGWAEPTAFGFPYIVLYTVALEAALFFLFLVFAKHFWTDEKGAS